MTDVEMAAEVAGLISETGPEGSMLTGEVRTKIELGVARVLLDGFFRAGYPPAFRTECARRGLTGREVSDPRADRGTFFRTLCCDGLPALSDAELLWLACRERWEFEHWSMEVADTMLDGFEGDESAGEYWRRAARMLPDPYPEPTPEHRERMLALIRDLSRQHDAAE